MRSADECLAQAKELSRLAALSQLPLVTARLLEIAEAWVDLAWRAEWHDSGKYAEALKAHLTRLPQPPDAVKGVAIGVLATYFRRSRAPESPRADGRKRSRPSR